MIVSFAIVIYIYVHSTFCFVPLRSKDFGREALIVNAHGHGRGQTMIVIAKGRKVATVNDAGFLSNGRTGYAIGSQLELSNVGGQFGFGDIFDGRHLARRRFTGQWVTRLGAIARGILGYLAIAWWWFVIFAQDGRLQRRWQLHGASDWSPPRSHFRRRSRRRGVRCGSSPPMNFILFQAATATSYAKHVGM
jgi:hypothetical protein